MSLGTKFVFGIEVRGATSAVDGTLTFSDCGTVIPGLDSASEVVAIILIDCGLSLGVLVDY